MTRLLGAITASGLLLILGSTVISGGRPLLGAMLCLAGFVAFAGTLVDPRSAGLAAVAVVAVGLLIGGRTMEGIGLILLLGVAALERHDDTPEESQSM